MMKIVRFRGRVFVLVGLSLVCLVIFLRTIMFVNDFNSNEGGFKKKPHFPDGSDDDKHQRQESAFGNGVPFHDSDFGNEKKRFRPPIRENLPPNQPTPVAIADMASGSRNRQAFHRITPGKMPLANDVDSDKSRMDIERQQGRNLNDNGLPNQSGDKAPGLPADPSIDYIIPSYLNRPNLEKSIPYPVLTKDGKFVPSRRIVHLDLKGAHPKFEFFRLLFPFLAQLGVTGILLEYEDVFPYTGILAEARSATAYSDNEVSQILAWARLSQLEVIPLVQTFGHLEWILKFEKFASYREVDRYAQVICLSNWDAVQLVKTIIDQVMRFHKDTSSFFHIGADEAFQVGQCSKCQDAIARELSGSRERLMVRHIANISSYVKETYGKQVLMWHDMLNNVDSEVIKEYKLDELAEPVVWAYAENLNEYLTPDIWQRFSANFPYIWGASAFKGADGPSRYHSNVPHYVRNHIAWQEQMQYQYKNFRQFRGLILTGWQRFDHFAVLCELLPVGIPSLAVSLLAINHGAYNKDILRLASQVMKCADTFIMEMPSYSNEPADAAVNYCQFPGARVYQLVQQCYNSQKAVHSKFLEDYQVRGWLSAYNIKHNYSSAWYLDSISQKIYSYHTELSQCLSDLRTEMPRVFRQDTIDEFLFEYILPNVKLLDELLNKSRAIAQIRHFPLRPFPIRDFLPPIGD